MDRFARIRLYSACTAEITALKMIFLIGKIKPQHNTTLVPVCKKMKNNQSQASLHFVAPKKAFRGNVSLGLHERDTSRGDVIGQCESVFSVTWRTGVENWVVVVCVQCLVFRHQTLSSLVWLQRSRLQQTIARSGAQTPVNREISK